MTMKKIGKLTIIGFSLLFVAYVFLSLRSTNYSFFDLSFITEKCIFCYFENRHHCHLCKAVHQQCTFCDKGVTIR